MGALIFPLIIILPCIVRILRQSIQKLVTELHLAVLIKRGDMPGASVRNPAHGKGPEEGGLTLHKCRIRPQGSPWTFLSIYPRNQSLPNLLHDAFTYTSDITEGYPPPPLSEKELT